MQLSTASLRALIGPGALCLFLTPFLIPDGSLSVATAKELTPTPQAGTPQPSPGTPPKLKAKRITGRYELADYGVSVVVPSEALVYGTGLRRAWRCAGHLTGSAAPWRWDPSASMYLFAEYTPRVVPPGTRQPRIIASNLEAEQDHLQELRAGGHDVTVLRVSDETLGTVPARRTVARIRTPASSSVTIQDAYFAIRHVAPEETILYRLTIEVPEQKYPGAKGILEKVATSFKALSVTPSESTPRRLR